VPSVAAKSLQIRAATVDDMPRISGTLANAFGLGQLADWICPDVSRRSSAYLTYARILYALAIKCGQIEVTTGDVGLLSDRPLGAAVWFPNPELVPDTTTDDDNDALMAAFGPDAFARLATLDEAIAHGHPALPHVQLAYIGVQPVYQNQGIGSQLLDHHHAQLDAAGVVSFLVATSFGARNLYQRHGYVITEEFRLPKDGPTLWAMVRHPAARIHQRGAVTNVVGGAVGTVVQTGDIHGDVRL
jgi:ribosomal protein S18 acetylase RimI-like enzyme